jgi:hypothetical protein
MESATWMPLTVAAVVVVATLVTVVFVIAGRRRLERELDASRAELDVVRDRIDELSRQVADRDGRHDPPVAHEFVITSLPDGRSTATLTTHDDNEAQETPQVSAGQFASVTLGESLVRLLSLGYGVGRALSPENRNRIRFAMRQEVRRARRQRRRDEKEARRHLRAHQAADEGADLAPDAPGRDADAA